MAKQKCKLIPLKELRALYKEAGVKVDEYGTSWDIWYEHDDWDECIFSPYVSSHWNPDAYRVQRQMLKAYLLGMIEMKKAGEI